MISAGQDFILCPVVTVHGTEIQENSFVSVFDSPRGISCHQSYTHIEIVLLLSRSNEKQLFKVILKKGSSPCVV